MSKRSGFSLVELLMVVAIILIVTTIALPNLMRSRFAATEAGAVSTMRLLNNVENQYAGTYNSFSGDLDSLGPPSGVPASAMSADLVDVVLAGRATHSTLQFSKAGYKFVYVPNGAYPQVHGFAVTADPTARGATGQRSFFMDQTGIIRWNATVTASINDSPIS